MVPVKLKLSNFTSYGENAPDLDFTKIHMALITGQNGVGKSSILDAITWCIWGSSRAGDNADSLVRLGQTQMYVEFEFLLGKNNFIIKRQRKISSGGSTALEFWSGTNNLTEGTIKSTQQKIIDTLRLTYDTFINSSYIRQGHADEFTTKGATQRKAILSDILGLSAYDKLEEKSKEKAKEADTKIKLMDYQLLEIEAELATKDKKIEEASQIRIEVDQKEKQIQEIEKAVKELESEKNTINIKYQSLSEKASLVENFKKELLEIKLQIELKEKAKEEHQSILDQKEEIEKNCKNLALLNEQKKNLENKRSELIKVKDELVSLQKVLNEREDKRKAAIFEVEIQIKKIETENKGFQDQIDHLKSHKDSCPTCGQIIGEQKNKEIINENEEKIKENKKQLDELKVKLEKYQSIVLPEKAQVEAKEIEVKKLEDDTKEYSPLLSQISDLQKYEDLNIKLQQAETAIKAHAEGIADLQKILTQRQSQIDAEQKNLEGLDLLKSQLLDIETRLQAQIIVKTEHETIARELRSKLGAAQALVDKTSQLEDVMKKKTEEKAVLAEEKSIYDELSLAFGKKGIQALIIETAIPEIEDETNSLLEKLTDGRMKVSLETQRETKTKVSNGEKGIVETLDIIISDEMGERAYELYSGGEAFRVNLSLRLALSKLLTRRAGSTLQFLIIDEGFGTQDSQGIARIIETLNIIKTDFEKILVITHLDELKEEFEAQIVVSKQSDGSTFQVVGV